MPFGFAQGRNDSEKGNGKSNGKGKGKGNGKGSHAKGAELAKFR